MIYYDTRILLSCYLQIFLKTYNYLNIDDNLRFYLADSVI